MPFAPFFRHFPDVACRETRSITVLNDDNLPRGTYAFVELFCNDEDCDCRRVFVHAVRDDGRPSPYTPLASISFGWEDESFYRDWGSFPKSEDDVAELRGPALVRLSPQSEHAPALLQHFKMLLQDEDYVERIARHYRLYRDAIAAENPEARTAPVRSAAKHGPNKPCPCGSGRKFKRCCWAKQASPNP